MFEFPWQWVILITPSRFSKTNHLLFNLFASGLWCMCSLSAWHCTDFGWCTLNRTLYCFFFRTPILTFSLLPISKTPKSHKSTARQWLPSIQTVDRIGLTFLCLPFIINNVCSIASGILGPTHLATAEIFIRLLYVFWFWHCGSLAVAVIYAGIKLVRLLQTHLKKFKSAISSSSSQAQKIQAGMFKIRGLVGVLFLALGGFAIFLLLYGLLRDQIIQSVPGSYALCALWNFLGPLASFFACLAVTSK